MHIRKEIPYSVTSQAYYFNNDKISYTVETCTAKPSIWMNSCMQCFGRSSDFKITVYEFTRYGLHVYRFSRITTLQCWKSLNVTWNYEWESCCTYKETCSSQTLAHKALWHSHSGWVDDENRDLCPILWMHNHWLWDIVKLLFNHPHHFKQESDSILPIYHEDLSFQVISHITLQKRAFITFLLFSGVATYPSRVTDHQSSMRPLLFQIRYSKSPNNEWFWLVNLAFLEKLVAEITIHAVQCAGFIGTTL